MTDIALFIPDLTGGGAERVVLNLAIGFANQGFKTDLVLVQAKGRYLPLVPPQVNLVVLGTNRLLMAFPSFVRYLQNNRPRILISALEETNIAAILGQKLARVPTTVIATVHNHLSIEAQRSTQLKRKLVPHLLRWVYPLADTVVAVSQGVAEDLARISRLPLSDIKVVYNPIVTSAIRAHRHDPIPHPWLAEKLSPVILGVGRLTAQKDFSTLIQAFAQIRQQRSARLIILGEGEERPHLESLIDQLNLTDSVALLGFVDNPYPYMRHSDLFVLSSAWEGFGNVLVEAMAMGTPVVSTDCKSGPAEILHQGRYGRLVPVGDALSLASAILMTLDQPIDAQTLMHRSEEFSLDKILGQYGQLAHLSTQPVELKTHVSNL